MVMVTPHSQARTAAGGFMLESLYESMDEHDEESEDEWTADGALLLLLLLLVPVLERRGLEASA